MPPASQQNSYPGTGTTATGISLTWPSVSSLQPLANHEKFFSNDMRPDCTFAAESTAHRRCPLEQQPQCDERPITFVPSSNAIALPMTPLIGQHLPTLPTP